MRSWQYILVALGVSLLGGLVIWVSLRGVRPAPKLAIAALVVAFGLWAAYQERYRGSGE